MAVHRKQECQPVDPQVAGAAMAEFVRSDPAVERLWVFSYHHLLQFWLLTPDVPAQEERRLYGLLDGMYARFPDTEVQLHIVSPRYFEPFELDVILPPGSAEIALNAV
jgi:hypothetical protein